MVKDARYQSLRQGLEQLSHDELLRLRDWLLTGGRIALDQWNYNASADEWCPLAIAVGLPSLFAGRQADNAGVTAILALLGLRVNNTRNVVGDFYRDNRRADLTAVVEEILAAGSP